MHSLAKVEYRSAVRRLISPFGRGASWRDDRIHPADFLNSVVGLRVLRFGLSCLLVSIVSLDGFALTLPGINCDLTTTHYAVGLTPPLRSVNVEGTDPELETWQISNPMGNLLFCDNPWIPLACEASSYWHHTGTDYLLGFSDNSIYSNNRPVYAVDNGIVVYSTNGNTNPSSDRGGLVVIKHVAPPGVKFYLPSYRESFNGSEEYEINVDLSFSEELVSYYLHLDEPLVSQGDIVNRGQQIATTYDRGEGYAYPPHLHLEMWRKCHNFDPNGYETQDTQFRNTVRDLIAHPDEVIRWNAEMVRIVPEGHGGTSRLRALGYDFGDTPGVLAIGSHVPMSLPPVEVPEGDWVNTAVRFDLFAPWPSVEVARQAGYPTRGLDATIRKNEVGARDRKSSYPFRDVKANIWYSEHVVGLQRAGVISGFGNTGFFLPHEEIKRSEFVKLLVGRVCPSVDEGVFCASQNGSMPFTDLYDHWAEPFVREAWNRGWLTSAPEFDPNGLVARADAAKLVAKALELPEAIPVETPFSDVSTSDWFAPYVVSLFREKILEGYPNGTFGPERQLLRSEAAKIIAELSLNTFGNLGGVR